MSGSIRDRIGFFPDPYIDNNGFLVEGIYRALDMANLNNEDFGFSDTDFGSLDELEELNKILAKYAPELLVANPKTPGSDAVSSPSHYVNGPHHSRCGEVIECIDVAGEMNFNTGNAIKYLWRYEHKGNPVQDLKKARTYIDFEIARLERGED